MSSVRYKSLSVPKLVNLQTAARIFTAGKSILLSRYCKIIDGKAASYGMTAMPNDLGRCLNLQTFLYPPFSYYIRDQEGNLVTVGIMTDVIKLIMGHFGFCYTITKWHSGGNLLQNGTWTELLSTFADGTADVGASIVALDNNRVQTMDYQVISLHAFSLMYKAPRIEPDLAGFVKPFTYPAWVSLFASMVCMVIALWLITKGTSYLQPKKMTASEETGILRALNICLRGLLTQDLPAQKMMGDRITVGTWLLMCFIVGAVYKSNLMAMLITPRVVRPFDSLDQLLESNVPFHLLKDSVVETASKQADLNTAMGQAAIKTLGFKRVTNLMETTEEVARGDYAFSLMSDAARFTIHNYYAQTGRCAFMIARETFLSNPVAVPLKRGSPLNPRIKKALTGLLEFGIIGKLVDDALKNVKICDIIEKQRASNIRSLQLEDFTGVLLLLVTGILLSLIVFIAELITGRRGKESSTDPGLT